MTTGSVGLPQRQVHAGTWFRLIRTIIDEMGISLSECTANRLIRRIWKDAGHPVWAGYRRWQTFEDYPLDVQGRLLEGAATAIHLLESGTIAGLGKDAALFLPPI